MTPGAFRRSPRLRATRDLDAGRLSARLPRHPRRSTPPHLEVGLGDVAESLGDPAIDDLADDDLARRLHALRLQFTQMSRELGRLYRTQRNIELRTDLKSIEAMQTQLYERYRRRAFARLRLRPTSVGTEPS